MHNSSMPKKLQYPLSRSECLCAICREILLEPVTLPCNHTLCLPCFQMTVEKASLCCPFCRLRVSTWARRSTRSGTLVNQELWDFIQRQYPEDCKRRACGLETEDDVFEDGSTLYPTPQLCEPGEIRQEYEAEISKIEAERLRIEEEERKASEEYIRKLLEEEEKEQRSSLERTQRDLEEQLKKDEELAWMLNSNLNDSKASSGHASPGTSPVNVSKTSNAKSSKSVKGKQSQSGDIERFLSPVSVKMVHIQESCHVTNGYTLNMNSSVEHNVSVLEDSDDEVMPILSPQPPAVDRSSVQESDTELQLPELTVSSPIGRSAYRKHVGQRLGNDSCMSISSVELSPPRCSTSQDGCRRWRKNSEDSSICSTPAQLHNETLKRTLASSGDEEDHVNAKRPNMSSLDNSVEFGSHTERLKELEENLHERKLQEEQDRLLALQLQKLLDKEQTQVRRQKGSPDEYKLRPKRTLQERSETESQKKAASKCSMSKSNAKGSESGDSPDENQKPSPPKCAPSRQAAGRTRKSAKLSSSPHGGKILRPSNKQQTILDMFHRANGN